MYKLTERRLAKAKPILETYRKQLHTSGFMAASNLESELRKCWNVGYQALKGIMIDLSKLPRYRYVAARYMESGCPGVVTEFQRTLSELYGMDSLLSRDKKAKKEAFWGKLKQTK
jgi:hypothetical protein